MVVSSKAAPSSLSMSSDTRAHPLNHPLGLKTLSANSMSHISEERSHPPRPYPDVSHIKTTLTPGVRSLQCPGLRREAKVGLPSHPPTHLVSCQILDPESRLNIPSIVPHTPRYLARHTGDGQTRHSTHTRTRRRPGRGNSACRPTIKSAETHRHHHHHPHQPPAFQKCTFPPSFSKFQIPQSEDGGVMRWVTYRTTPETRKGGVVGRRC